MIDYKTKILINNKSLKMPYILQFQRLGQNLIIHVKINKDLHLIDVQVWLSLD